MSGGSNQRTLFQAWGASVGQNKGLQPGKDVRKTAEPAGTASSRSRPQVAPANPPIHQTAAWTVIGQNSTHANGTQYIIPDDEDDDLMVVAVYEAERGLQLENSDNLLNNPATGRNVAPSPSPRCGKVYPDFPGFDSSSADVWIYPTNYPIREYQLKISEAALFQNTLVCLPTGLGKTFIASVVMYNFYRWYPAGKIVFMAPTKPLVAQQIEACYKVMGIPQEHMAELTGSTAAKQRQEVWRSKRVFFLTPQVMVNDLSRDTCPARQIKCVVIDEAHKALGNHAYCQVIRQLSSQTLQFRILALSATPGGDAKSVQSVISNLLISHIELRSEESPDIQAHSHQRNVEKVVVPLGEKLSAHQARYLQVLEKFMSRLVQNRVMGHKDLRTLGKYQLILARDQFRKNPPPHIKGSHQGVLEGDFALCISLYHGYELLMQMGLRSLFFYMQGIMDGSREMSRAKNELQRTPTFMDLYHEMETMFLKPPDGPDEPFIYSHPKLEKLEEVVLQHFNVWAQSSESTNDGVSTRVMIFSSFRESVQEIASMLNRHAPLIRVMTFMGQASAGKGVKGFTQKEQLEVVHRFRQGGFNTLVSTCVGEEGLDIGEVDLIVCFDAQKNPIRLVQRMGRTGRKRRGRIVVILTEGREERTYNQSQSNKRSVHKSITGNKNGFRMYPNSPRMLPEELNPQLHKMHITVGQFDHREGSRRSVRGRRSHSEGRPSLIHPQNLIQQHSPTSDGFLSRAEYSLWASSMKLKDDEAHPTLKLSHFVSIPDDSTPQEGNSKDEPPSRELSLWEWRHWQHKPLPFHAVDHSLRCHHFIKVMELIDCMRDETEGECLYEQQLVPYILREDTDKKRQKKPKAPKMYPKNNVSKPRPSLSSRSDLEYIDGEVEMENSTLVPEKQGLSDEHTTTGRPGDDSRPEQADSPSHNSENDCAIVNVKEGDQTLRGHASPDSDLELDTDNDEDVALQEMFYIPKTRSAPLLHFNKPRGHESLKAILANVAELLCRSPPPLENILETEKSEACLPASPQLPLQPFPVSFSLEVDDDDDDGCDDIAAPDEPAEIEGGSKDREADSPTWDEVFEDEEFCYENIRNDKNVTDWACAQEHFSKENEHLDGKRVHEAPHIGDPVMMDDEAISVNVKMDESMDLFEDDEAFMQMSIPDVPTPEESLTTGATLDANHDGWIEKVAKDDCTEILNAGKIMADCKTPVSEASLKIRGGHKTTEGRPHLQTTAEHYQKAASLVQEHPEPLDSSHDFFPVNFDLGYSLEDSEDEAEVEAAPATQSCNKQAGSAAPLPAVSVSSTPRSRFTGLFHESTLSSQITVDLWKSKTEELPSPVTSLGARRTLLSGFAEPTSSGLKRRQAEGNAPWQEPVQVEDSSPNPAECYSESEEEVVHHKRRHLKVNPLSSPEVSKILSDVDSPVVAKMKRASALNTTDEAQAGAFSDDDFQNSSVLVRRKAPPGAKRQRVQQQRNKNGTGQKVRQFLDEEAELSEDDEGADVSSDEEDDEDLNRSLEGFVVDNMHLSQGLNDSEMQGVYLKSVRSPAVQGKFKMSYKNHHNMDIFSQVPEMDETYAEDSFVVGSDEELESCEEEPENVELLPEVLHADGRRQYATRRRVFLHKARAVPESKTRTQKEKRRPERAKTKRSRVIRLNDSSEEEEQTEEVRKTRSPSTGRSAAPLQETRPHPDPSGQKSTSSASATIASKVSLLSKGRRSSPSEEQRQERYRRRLENQHFLSDELDFAKPVKELEGLPSTSSPPQDPSVSELAPGSVCVLVDSRCISGAVELVTSLRQRHGANVHVCSLDGNYFIVSNRMAVDRHSQSDLATIQNRKRLAERLRNLWGMFDRVCLIVEKDRYKQGEVSRPFQRTRYYDSTLAALVRAGIRLLWSDGPEQSAGLLAELAKLEQRKGQGITVPLEVKGQRRQQALQLYLSLPSVSHIHALNLLHNFRSVAELMNSSVDAIQKGGCMSRTRAEEIYRLLRHSCDPSYFTNASKAGKNS